MKNVKMVMPVRMRSGRLYVDRYSHRGANSSLGKGEPLLVLRASRHECGYSCRQCPPNPVDVIGLASSGETFDDMMSNDHSLEEMTAELQ